MQYNWVAYSGADALILGAILLAVTAGLVIVAVRLRHPVPGAHVSPGALVLLVILWLLTIAMVLVGVAVYAVQASEVHLVLPSPPNPVTPVTIISAGLSFVIVAVTTQAGFLRRAGNALLCACVAPMIFELPFDLIVMARTTQIPPAAGLYIAVFFLPLFAVELVTITLTLTRPGVRITRWTAAGLAEMFGVFALWALTGFHYPITGLPLALNIISKLLAFAVALSMFLRREDLQALRRS